MAQHVGLKTPGPLFGSRRAKLYRPPKRPSTDLRENFFLLFGDAIFNGFSPKAKTVPEDKSSPRVPPLSVPAGSLGEDDFYRKLVQRHRDIVEDYSRIEAKIRLLETEMEKALSST
jgi:hypothetical protein